MEANMINAFDDLIALQELYSDSSIYANGFEDATVADNGFEDATSIPRCLESNLRLPFLVLPFDR